jgi:CRISPR/Cas system-associated exonuclease Cas4 (RecB family)
VVLEKLNDNVKYNDDSYGGEVEQGFHPSAIAGMGCFRKEILKFYAVMPDEDALGINPDLRRIFDNGHSMHDRWQRYMTLMSQGRKDIQFIGSYRCKGCGNVLGAKKEITEPKTACKKCGSKRWKYNEFRLRDENLRITGKRDGKLLIDGEPYLLELKSINTFSFMKLNDAMPDHLIQFNIYMYLDKTYKGLILYEDKNSQRYRIFVADYDEKIIQKNIEFIKKANIFVDKRAMPPVLDDYPKNPHCKGCEFKKKCPKVQMKDKK